MTLQTPGIVPTHNCFVGARHDASGYHASNHTFIYHRHSSPPFPFPQQQLHHVHFRPHNLSLQSEFLAKDELVTIVPKISSGVKFEYVFYSPLIIILFFVFLFIAFGPSDPSSHSQSLSLPHSLHRNHSYFHSLFPTSQLHQAWNMCF